MNQDNNKNLMMALVLSAIVMGGWYYLYEIPRMEAAKKQQELVLKERAAAAGVTLPTPTPGAAATTEYLPREQALEASPRVTLSTPRLHGSIALRGARFDDLSLAQYKETPEPGSPEVVLLAPKESKGLYFGSFGWLSNDTSLQLPDENTLWHASADTLTTATPLVLTWENEQHIKFEITVSLDDDYLFHIKQSVLNNSGAPVEAASFGLLNRSYTMPEHANQIIHEGPMGVFTDQLEESGYKQVKEDKEVKHDLTSGWVGISDKYWLTALIPLTKDTYKTRFQYYAHNNDDRYQVDMLGQMQTIAPGATLVTEARFYAGAKEVRILDKYTDQYQIPLFDRAVDFGMLYFITKPLFYLLHFFHELVGNFGVAIILLTLTIRIALFPLANKSYKSMAQMKTLMPKMNEIRERYADDKLKMNKEIMELYRREKVNPASGCLPMLVQLPIFFSLYKVLFVTIEMRHAPFFAWIHDLSAKDPTNIFTLFGLIHWDPPTALHIGALPLIMTCTTFVQQRLNPKPADATQAMMMQWMPLIFLVLFANFPAGLVVYWTFNNFFSIIQQWTITKRLNRSSGKKKTVSVAA